MRTNVVLDDDLMKKALTFSGLKTKKSAIEEGLRLLVQMHAQNRMRKLRGKVAWEGDLETMRRD